MRNSGKPARYLLLIAVSVVMLFPYVWMILTSLKDYANIFLYPPQWWPQPIAWDNYVELFAKRPFHLYLYNSIYIGIVATIGTCLFAAMAGYAFARLQFPFKNVIFLILLSSMMIPTEATTIPLFIWMSKLGLVDTHFPLIFPQMLGAGGMFGVFLMRQFFITVPKDLMEAAKIDGCGYWRIFYAVMMPLAFPMLSTLSVITFLHSWNEFFEPLVYLNSSRLFTVPLALSLFTTEAGTEWHLIMAASVVATFPLLAVFFAAQRKFIEGVAMTGIK